MDLMGVTEIAEMAGVGNAAVSNWQRREWVGFPEPLVTLACGPIWDKQAIEKWLADRKAKQTALRERKIKQLEKELKQLKGVK